MASALIATEAVETHVQSGLPTARLDDIVDAVDAEIIRLFGQHAGEQTTTLRISPPSDTVYLPQPAATVSSVVHWRDGVAEDDATEVTDYVVVHGGRGLTRRFDRSVTWDGLEVTRSRYGYGTWLRNVKATYTPVADTARRVQVLIDLVKWELAYSGHTRTTVGRMETYAPTQSDRAMILRRLRQQYAGAGLLA